MELRVAQYIIKRAGADQHGRFVYEGLAGLGEQGDAVSAGAGRGAQMTFSEHLDTRGKHG